ncbi:MAG: metal ABC transporter permease [Solirubrobacteraceae bacterium]
MTPSPSPNPLQDLRLLFTYPFMAHALAAGTLVALLGGAVGFYVVLRRQAFASHTLSVMAFPGAAGAALAGLPLSLGYYLACTAAALTLGAGRGGVRSRRIAPGSDSALVGTVQVVGLGVGFLLLSLDQAVLGGPETLLFGSFLGITQGQVLGLAVVCAAALAALAVLARPLLLASIDPELARAGGAPVALLDTAFVAILGLAVAATSQITGALLVLAVLVAPAAGAQRLTARPAAGLALSVCFALGIVWLWLAIAYFSVLPVGFCVTTPALILYAVTRAA